MFYSPRVEATAELPADFIALRAKDLIDLFDVGNLNRRLAKNREARADYDAFASRYGKFLRVLVLGRWKDYWCDLIPSAHHAQARATLCQIKRLASLEQATTIVLPASQAYLFSPTYLAQVSTWSKT